jgi:2-dehydro-3-deoxyphosphooctonate aldolase (KDO 8-P synthase)
MVKVGRHLRNTVRRVEDHYQTEINWYLKGSFDKANRSLVTGGRGPGLSKGVKLFRKVKKALPDVKLLTDIHEARQAPKIAPAVDGIQVPAFLCRQTDLLVAAGAFFDFVNVKKGQWMSPENCRGIADKVRKVNPGARVAICERGTVFGYQKFIVDLSSVPQLKPYFDDVILDCTHSTQYVNQEGRMKGDRGLAAAYLRTAPVFGYTGVFSEVHPNPATAPSDGTSMIKLEDIDRLLWQHMEVYVNDSPSDSTG